MHLTPKPNKRKSKAMLSLKRATTALPSVTTQRLSVSHRSNSRQLFCVEIQPHEAVLSNRAASFIAIKDYKNALDDIKFALRINPQFTRCYKRLFKANLGLGNIDDASQAL